MKQGVPRSVTRCDSETTSVHAARGLRRLSAAACAAALAAGIGLTTFTPIGAAAAQVVVGGSGPSGPEVQINTDVLERLGPPGSITDSGVRLRRPGQASKSAAPKPQRRTAQKTKPSTRPPTTSAEPAAPPMTSAAAPPPPAASAAAAPEPKQPEAPPAVEKPRESAAASAPPKETPVGNTGANMGAAESEAAAMPSGPAVGAKPAEPASAAGAEPAAATPQASEDAAADTAKGPAAASTGDRRFSAGGLMGGLSNDAAGPARPGAPQGVRSELTAVDVPSRLPPARPTTAVPGAGQRMAALPPNQAAPKLGSKPVSIAFSGGAVSLAADQQAMLAQVAQQLVGNDQRVLLSGYASGTGDAASGARRVALSRVLAVRKYLIEKGIANTRIDVRALGTPSDGSAPERVDISPIGG